VAFSTTFGRPMRTVWVFRAMYTQTGARSYLGFPSRFCPARAAAWTRARRRIARRDALTRAYATTVIMSPCSTSSVRAHASLARGTRVGTVSGRRSSSAGTRPARAHATMRGGATASGAESIRFGSYGGFVDGHKLAGALQRGDGRGARAGFEATVRAATRAAGRAGKKITATMMPIGVPRVPYKTPNESMWQWVDIWNCLYRERIIWIGQTIDEELGNQLVATLLFLDSVDKNKPIYLYINSDGGQIVPTMAILDTMKHVKSEVGTVGFGSARAMGGLLLASGAKGKRAVLPNTCIMLHHPSGVARGAASDIQNEGKELLRIRAYVNKLVSNATGQPVEKISEDIRRDKHFTPQAALEYGIIDKVLYRNRK
jgi:ATP-dependent Clp protease, protease subunit